MQRNRKNKTLRFLKKYHKWVSLALTPLIILFAISGIVLNHRETFSPVDVSRKFLPDNYTYKNWNLAAVKGSLNIGNDSLLMYGNIGIWLTDSSFSRFTDFNRGFPKGIDNRKISSMAITGNNHILAGTFFGLYRLNRSTLTWDQVSLPIKEKRIVKVLRIGEEILVLTRSHLLKSTDGLKTFTEIRVPSAFGHDTKVSLFRTIWMIHSGEIYGIAGKLIMDAIALIFIFITITGLIYFFVPLVLKKLSESVKQKVKRINKFSITWHNHFGVWTFVLLVISAATGIFLRPPLLITIAESRIAAIPGTIMSQSNPWFDKLRDLIYDENKGRFILSTNEGFYYSDDGFATSLTSFAVQPPVSVMGINVFEKSGDGKYLIGSFSGLFSWHPEEGTVMDLITGEPVKATLQSGPPFGAVSVAGYIKTGNNFMIFDYANGMTPLTGKGLPPMPDEIVSKSPISLWNFSLEIHTGRIFENILGLFYILVVPITGLALLFSLVTGLWLWLKLRRMKKD